MTETYEVPHSTEAEEWVIGSVLKRAAAMAGVQSLPPEDFYDRRYQAIWRACLDLWNRAIPIDYGTLSTRLKGDDLAAAKVGMIELSDIDLHVPSAAHIQHYANIVADTATQRRYISAAQKIAEAAYRPGCEISELMSQSEALLSSARPSDHRRDLLEPEQWAQALTDDLMMRQEGGRTAVLTGLHDLDLMTLGLDAGRLYLLMGIPGHGKSELALQIAIHVALNSGPVLFASLEMTDVELAQRYVRITRGVDRNRLAITVGRNGLTPDDWTLVAAALAEMTSGRLWPASPRGQYTTADLRSDATAVQAKSGKIALIVADYVQRFRDRSGKYSSREENVALIAQNLKSLAREFGCPVLAPVQPNRDYKGRLSNPRPVLTDLRESGSLEGEADVVLGLYRDEKHNEESRDRGIMEVHMLKNRSGAGDEMGCRKLVWRGHRYDNYAALPTGAMVA